MSAATEVTRLRRTIQTLREFIQAGTGTASRAPMSAIERRQVRSEIEVCIQELDELRNRLAG